MKILIVEDDVMLGELLQECLLRLETRAGAGLP